MYDIQWLVGTGIAAGVVGMLLGWLTARAGGKTKSAKELGAELEASQAALKDYKAEVFEQFGETARKFETLNESYADLHKQLATSATLLCADMGNGPLLSGPDQPAAQEDTDSTDVDVDVDVDGVEITATAETVKETLAEDTDATTSAAESVDNKATS